MQYGILHKNNTDPNMGFVHFDGARVFLTDFLPNIRSLSTPVARGRGGRARFTIFNFLARHMRHAKGKSPVH